MTSLATPTLPQDLPRAALLAAIGLYKRRVSPHKGFACAYRIRAGRREAPFRGVSAAGCKP